MSINQKVQSFFSKYPTRMYSRDDILVQPGVIPQAFYLVQGIVSQYDIAKNGQKLVVNTYKPGAFISLSCILNNAPSSFFFEASGGQVVVNIAPAVDVYDFLKDNPDVTLDALSRLSRGGDGMMQRLARAMEGDAEARILQELLIIRDRFPESSKETSITDVELAARTGLARETVNRTLKRLVIKGNIKSSRGKITLNSLSHI